MRGTQIFIGLIALFITLPLSFLQGWLLYSHVHATDFMWFLWWFNIPIVILVQALSVITSKLIEKKDK